jgi:tetratricopeptide (TPR) repeat protein
MLRLPSCLLLLALFASACSAPRIDLEGWREQQALLRPAAERGSLAADLARIHSLRAERQLEAARRLALSLAAEHPDDPAALSAASRAESDGLVLFMAAQKAEKSVRNAAASSARDYAERAAARGASSPADRAQLAWALGASTHLESMGARAAHARRTLELAEAVLAEDPQQPVALATLAIVHLRLQTLPWIANLMASGLPDSSLEQAIDYARRATHAEPSRENHLILARCLAAADQRPAAQQTLEQALALPPTFPRDTALEPTLAEELAKLR